MENKKIRKILVADSNKDVIEYVRENVAGSLGSPEEKNNKVTAALSIKEVLSNLKKRKYDALFLGGFWNEISREEYSKICKSLPTTLIRQHESYKKYICERQLLCEMEEELLRNSGAINILYYPPTLEKKLQ